jgi:hypothetical protein
MQIPKPREDLGITQTTISFWIKKLAASMRTLRRQPSLRLLNDRLEEF